MTETHISVLIIIPVYNDWPSLDLLIEKLDASLATWTGKVVLLIVNDGSTTRIALPGVSTASFKGIVTIRVIDLLRNIGHQRSIALGLTYAQEHLPAAHTVVMDADGEDSPEDVKRLLEASQNDASERVIFASRIKRSEGMMFSIFYFAYKAMFYFLTGHTVRGGNFSVIPAKHLARVSATSDIWNHYAAGVAKARIPLSNIPTERAPRLAGASSMNFVALVIHGLSSIAVYGDVVGVRLLIATCCLILFCVSGICFAITIRLFTDLAIPGWATYVIALLLILLMQAVVLSLFFIFLVLTGKGASNLYREPNYSSLISATNELVPRK